MDRPPVVTARCILVTGSRNWTDARALTEALDGAVAEAIADGVTELIVRHGACYPIVDRERGMRPYESADWLAHLWIDRFRASYPITITEDAMPADWTGPCRPTCNTKKRRNQTRDHRQQRGGRSTCPAAGVYRNIDMIRKQPQPYRGLAFRLDGSAGTTRCIDRMREFSIPVEPVERTSR